jgi:glycine oxidase
MARGRPADVTVRGAGIFGLSIAWACHCRGARVRVVESTGLGAGSSGGLVGALSPHVPETWNAKKAFQLDSLLMAADWWAGVEAASGMPSGYARLGRLQPLADDRAVTAARRRQIEAEDLWHGAATWRVVPASGADWEPISPSGFLVKDTLSARLSPRMGLGALAGALREGGVEITLGDGEDAGQVIHATGLAGLVELSQALGVKVGSGVKGQALALKYEAPMAPQLFVDGLHIVPHTDGTVAIGSTSEATWHTDGPDTLLDGLLAKAIAAVPALAGAAVVACWAGVRPKAASRAPVLGPWPGRSGHFVANGGFKIGFGMAPKVAEVMADLVLVGHDAIPQDFRLETLLQATTARR